VDESAFQGTRSLYLSLTAFVKFRDDSDFVIDMIGRMKIWRVLIALLALSSPVTLTARPKVQIQPRQESQYSRTFFVQLKGIFGRFRDADLDRVFDSAEVIQCPELVSDKGEWRTVAFFNEKRELGDWYRSNLDEVKHDLAVFAFSGVCRGEHGPVQLTTKFPVTESIQAFIQQKIELEQVEVNVNAPVRASFDATTSAYSFDLPYLFLIKQDDSGADLYSLDPPRLADRQRYATDVVDHWDCKSVTGGGVTYRFLICKTTTLPRIPSLRSQPQRPVFGASAYFILSDGEEASSNVKLTFNDTNDQQHEVEDASARATASDAPSSALWEVPDSDEKIVDVLREDFRIRFAQSWANRIGSAQALYGRQILNLDSAKPAEGADYCIWLAGAGGSSRRLLDDADSIQNSITVHDRDNQSSTSIALDMRTPDGMHLGTFQCYFPRATSATSVDFGRWKAIVGDNVVLEVKP
jgi:hypothetical protein